MKVKVKLFATLRAGRFSEKEFEINDGSDVELLLNILHLKHEDVPIIFINGRHAGFDAILAHNDEIAFFPPVGGG